jgi:hypothetical protein
MLDRPNSSYYSGEIVSGYVFLQVSSNEEVRSVKLTFSGAEHTMVRRSRTVRDGDRSRTVHETIRDSSNIAQFTIVLYGNPDRGSRVPLNAGQRYALPFSFQVPVHCPSSCYLSEHAHISYMLHAEVDRPWAFDYNAYLQPRILSPVGCSNPSDLVAREANKDHEICCWPCSRGHIYYSFQIPYGAYAFGERIPIQADIRNESSEKIFSLNASLRRIWRYTARSHTDTFVQTLDQQVFTLNNGAGMITGELGLPYNLDVPSFVGRLISVDYFLILHLNIDGCCVRDNEVNLPITAANIARDQRIPSPPKFTPPPTYDASFPPSSNNAWPENISPPLYDENSGKVKREDFAPMNATAQSADWQ